MGDETSEAPVVVLDKSYLFGASVDEVQSLCTNYRMLATPGLIYELLKEVEPDRSYCFRKFPKGTNPVTLIDRLGGLLRYEAENLAPCTPIWDHRLPLSFEFNDRLAAGDYQGPPELWETMREEQANIDGMTSGFIECASFIPGWCPDLKGYRAGSSPETIEGLQTEVATSPDTVRRLYQETHDERFPPAEVLGPSWAHYRRLQLWIIAGLEVLPGIRTTWRANRWGGVDDGIFSALEESSWHDVPAVSEGRCTARSRSSRWSWRV